MDSNLRTDRLFSFPKLEEEYVRIDPRVVTVAPAHPKSILPDAPDLLKVKLLLDRVLKYRQSALLWGEGF